MLLMLRNGKCPQCGSSEVTSNFVNDLYVARKAPVGLVPVQPAKKTRGYIPGNVGDLCAYHDPKIDQISNQLLGLAHRRRCSFR
jgi:hypothetical protein